jgi:hypothetical protein
MQLIRETEERKCRQIKSICKYVCFYIYMAAVLLYPIITGFPISYSTPRFYYLTVIMFLNNFFLRAHVPRGCNLGFYRSGSASRMILVRGRIQRETFVWDPMTELTITSPYFHSRTRFNCNTFTMGTGQPYARVDLNPMPESTLSLSQGLWIWPQIWQRDQSPNFFTFKEPRNRFQIINSASLCSLAGRYDNPIPTRFLAPTDCLKIPA